MTSSVYRFYRRKKMASPQALELLVSDGCYVEHSGCLGG